MAPLFFFFFLLLLSSSSHAGPISTEFLYPNSTFTTFHFVDTDGVFLSSPNSDFSAALYDPNRKGERFYLSLLHSPSGAVVWTANPGSPVPFSSTLSLSSSSLSLLFPNSTVSWSTPDLHIRALRLLDSGNLLLLDAANSTLWQSFDHPTNTLLPGQRLPSGSHLTSPTSDSDLSDGGYRLIVTPDDASLSWSGIQRYWTLSADATSVKDYSAAVAYMALNATGLFLFDSSDRAVFRVALPMATGFRAGIMGSDGRFTVGSNDFVAPSGECGLPLHCGSLGLCTSGSNRSSCGCPPSFGAAANAGCAPADGSALVSSSPQSSSCGGVGVLSYLVLGSGIGYFADKYLSAAASGGGDLSSCRSLCSTNCSCLGFFYRNSSQSCYLLKDQLGSLIRSPQPLPTGMGYIKVLKPSSPVATTASARRGSSLLPIFLPSIATILLLLTLSFVGFKWWRRRRNSEDHISRSPVKEVKLGQRQPQGDNDEFSDGDEISIPGLPTRFTYTELALATNNFSTLIGAGGFGSVYKGELPDRTLVAVKRITNMGIQGKREFCTEIAVIGKIHHVNLVRLRGFCVQGTDRMLVYDYMNRSSLDRSLFRQGPVLEWQERLEIAIGAARGLAYLHSGCDRKIIHCDIKPENILLADGGQVKIADFGMAKLMSPDQSGLFTAMRGTRGYLAPEWLTNSAITDKTDVYSYGMVLLEMIRGRKNWFGRSGGGGAGSAGTSSGSSFGSSEEYFPMVAVEKHVEGSWPELADPRMGGRVPEEEVERAVKVALCCLHEEPAMRPGMGTVAGMLEGTAAVWEPRVAGLRFLRLYRRGIGEGTVDCAATSESSTTAASASLLTYMSSQEVSGPR